MTGSTITRSEIITRLAKAINIQKQKANLVLDTVLDEMIEGLIRDHELKLSSFGTFLVRQKGKRLGRNPKTGVEVPITPRKTTSFRPSHLLKAKVIHGRLKKIQQLTRMAS